MKKKNVFIVFFIAFFIALLFKILTHTQFFNLFTSSKSIVINENKTYTLKKTFKKEQCYQVGLHSSDKLFYSTMYEPFVFKNSTFKLKFLNEQNQILKTTIINKDSALRHSWKTGGMVFDSTSVTFDVFNIPLKNYKKIKVVLEVGKLNDKYKDKKVKFYFKKYRDNCDMEALKILDYKHSHPITRKEDNATLKPLFKALVSKDTKAVKDILENNQSLCDSNFIGNRTVFTYSAYLDDFKTLSYLIDKCGTKKLHLEDVIKKTPLVYAIEHNSTKVLDLLFENGGECPEVLTNEYIKTYVGSGITYRKGAWGKNISKFVYSYNLPEIADVLLKYRCINVNEKRINFGRSQTWIELMEIDMRGTQQMKDDNDSGWKLQKDYTELLKVFKKYSKKYQKENNITQGIANGK